MSALARVRLAEPEVRAPRPRHQPGFRSQLEELRETKPADDRAVRDRDRQAPKRRLERDDDDVVICDPVIKMEVPVQAGEVAEIKGISELPAAVRVAQLARGSGQIAIPELPQAPAPTAAKLPQVELPTVPLTPLEQAVQDLITQLDGAPDEKPHAQTVDSAPIASPDLKAMPPIMTPKQHAAIAPVRDLAIEMASPTSHVHLVIDDGNERIVVTVAVRGNDVNVALRSGDDATTSSLARNAGSLDHAMRARGLDLAEFSAEPDRESAKHEQPEQRPDHDGPTFSMEDLA